MKHKFLRSPVILQGCNGLAYHNKYYTSAEVPPLASFAIKIRKERIDLQWQEMTALTVP